MLDLSVIVLTFNEEIHIRRCLENVRALARDIFVIDSFSADKTVEIAKEYPNVQVVQHEWPGNQAEQFNWALDALDIRTKWVLRLDADEYLESELIEELKAKLPNMDEAVSALSIPLGRAFCGRVLHHGIVNGIKIVRLFRYGKARYERRLMDEHLSILSGETGELEHKFIDDNRIPIGQFVSKHNGYASREAAMLLDAEFNLADTGALPQDYGEEVVKKRAQKARYARMPLFWRAFGYFCYRYFLKLGFLDGKEGFLWDFLQGWWYRTLVDAKVFEIKRACGTDKDKIKRYLKSMYNITL